MDFINKRQILCLLAIVGIGSNSIAMSPKITIGTVKNNTSQELIIKFDDQTVASIPAKKEISADLEIPMRELGSNERMGAYTNQNNINIISKGAKTKTNLDVRKYFFDNTIDLEFQIPGWGTVITARKTLKAKDAKTEQDVWNIDLTWEETKKPLVNVTGSMAIVPSQ